jgi:hypothetical protein
MASVIKGELKVQLKKETYDYYPYMDTFVCFNYISGVLSSDEGIIPSKGWYKLVSTRGEFDGDNVVWSNWYDEYIDESTAVYSRTLQDYIKSDESIWVKSVDDYFPNNYEGIRYSDWDGEYYMEDDVYYSEYLKTFISIEDSVMCWYNTDEELAVPKEQESKLVKEVDVRCVYNGSSEIKKLKCFGRAIMKNLQGEWIFKLDWVKVYYCKKLNALVD